MFKVGIPPQQPIFPNHNPKPCDVHYFDDSIFNIYFINGILNNINDE